MKEGKVEYSSNDDSPRQNYAHEEIKFEKEDEYEVERYDQHIVAGDKECGDSEISEDLYFHHQHQQRSKWYPPNKSQMMILGEDDDNQLIEESSFEERKLRSNIKKGKLDGIQLEVMGRDRKHT